MKRHALLTSALACGFSALLVAGNGLANDNPNNEKSEIITNAGKSKSDHLGKKKAGINTRVSKLMGLNIKNSQGKNVGEINDIVLDASNGKARYAAVTYGGFLGFGNKLFAVPFEAFEVKRNPDDRDECLLILNVTQQQLDGAQGFDKEHWPNFADTKFTQELDKRYGIDAKMRNHDLSRAKAGQLDDKTTGANIRASQLSGMNIQNSQGKSVGEINDIVLDSSQGKVRYAAVTYGGFLGVGSKMFAVPFEAFKVQQNPKDQDEYVLVLNVTQEQLEGAQGFDNEHWPNFADPKFTKDLHKRYGVDIRVKRNGLDVGINSKPKSDL
tara:strand:+ start:233886 stop:234863 length:978 start_codon:yes stop_codon:yes gene_type:complete